MLNLLIAFYCTRLHYNALCAKDLKIILSSFKHAKKLIYIHVNRKAQSKERKKSFQVSSQLTYLQRIKCSRSEKEISIYEEHQIVCANENKARKDKYILYTTPYKRLWSFSIINHTLTNKFLIEFLPLLREII